MRTSRRLLGVLRQIRTLNKEELTEVMAELNRLMPPPKPHGEPDGPPGGARALVPAKPGPRSPGSGAMANPLPVGVKE